MTADERIDRLVEVLVKHEQIASEDIGVLESIINDTSAPASVTDLAQARKDVAWAQRVLVRNMLDALGEQP